MKTASTWKGGSFSFCGVLQRVPPASREAGNTKRPDAGPGIRATAQESGRIPRCSLNGWTLTHTPPAPQVERDSAPKTSTGRNSHDLRHTLLSQRCQWLARALPSKVSPSRGWQLWGAKVSPLYGMERLPWFERPSATSPSRMRSTDRQAWPWKRPLPPVFISLGRKRFPLDNHTEELRTPHSQLFAFFRRLSEMELAQKKGIATVGI